MIYLRIEGRLGNQMFQYSIARRLQIESGSELYIDFGDTETKGGDGFDDSLKQFMIAPYNIGNLDLIDATKLKLLKIIWRTKPKHGFLQYFYEVLTKPIFAHFGIYHIKSTYKTLSIKPLKNIDTYIEGYFESADYFKEIDILLRTEFQPRYPLSQEESNLQDILSHTTSICVSVRRGDFMSLKYKKRFQTCDIDYYERGIALIRKQYPLSIIYICSDDITWCKENFSFEGKVIYEPLGLTLAHKLALMSACSHFVISNSTFSWWAQHLSNNKDKIVVAPRIWRNETPRPQNIQEKNWTYID